MLTSPRRYAGRIHPASHRIRCWLGILACLILATGCGDGFTDPDAVGDETPEASPDISDGAHNDGNPHVFFLPPMVANFDSAGSFDATLTPRVEVCPSDLTGCTGPAIASFPFGTDEADTRLIEDEALYQANWHTDQFSLDQSAYYRIRVLQASLELAFADVQVMETSARNAKTNETFALKDGRTLPIKVRIEEGAAGFAPAAAGSDDGNAAVEVPAGALEDYVELTVEPIDENNPPEPLPDDGTALPGTLYDFGPDGQTFDEPVELSLAIPAALPVGVVPESLHVYVAGANGWEPLPGSVDLANGVVTGLTSHFSNFAILPGQVTNCSSGGYGTLDSALAAVGPRGTIIVCAGTHDVDSVSVNKAVTIQGDTGTTPVIRTPPGARASLFVENMSSGSVRLRNLTFDNESPRDLTQSPALNTYSVYARTTYDSVEVDSVTFTALSSATGNIIAVGSTVPTARLMVQNSSFTGGVVGVNVVTGPNADVLDNVFSTHGLLAVQLVKTSALVTGNTMDSCGTAECIYAGGGANATIAHNLLSGAAAGADPIDHRTIWVATTATATIVGDSIDGCGSGQCIQVSDGATANVDSTQITVYESQGTRLGLIAVGSGSQLTATNSSIIGIDEDGNASTYATQYAAIQAEAGAVVTATGDSVTHTAIAFTAYTDPGGTPGVIQSARDNVVDSVGTAFNVVNGSSLTAGSNDVTSADYPIDVSGGYGTLNLRCNWWGAGTGPADVDSAIPLTLYRPWATAPVAQGGSSCVPTSLAVTVSVAPNASDPSDFGNLHDALSVVATGGTVTLGAGTFDADGVSVTKPVTIQGTSQAGSVVRTPSGSQAGLFVDGVTSGVVTLRNLTFDNESPRAPGLNTYSLYLLTTYDSVVVDSVAFTALSTATGNIAAVTSTVPAARLVAQHSSFNGGLVGVNVLNAPNVELLSNSFSSHGLFTMRLQNTSANVTGNTMDSCGTAECIYVAAGANATIAHNLLSGTAAGADSIGHRTIFVALGANATIRGDSIDGCGPGECIQVSGGASATVDSTHITLYESDSTRLGMTAYGTGSQITATNSSIIGVDQDGDSSTYATKYAAIQAEAGAVVTATGNTVKRTAIAFAALGNVGGPSGVIQSARDNVVDSVGLAFNVFNGSSITAGSNNVTNFGSPINIFGGYGTLNLQCNWWGADAAPASLDVSIPLAVYKPWAQMPVAGMSIASCSGGP